MSDVMHGNGMLVLLRHGKSSLNEDGRFSGWADCPLTPEGIRQAHAAGRDLHAASIVFDACFTSVLSRTVDTADIVLDEMGLTGIPITRSWMLNERHYGILEGELKSEVIARYGAAQMDAWRNSADAAPPPLAIDDTRHPRHKVAYDGIPPDALPDTECLRAAFKRVIDFFEEAIRPLVSSGKSILVVSHGNPVRALIAHFGGCPDGDIPNLEIRNATPIAYESDQTGRFVDTPLF